MWYQDVLVTLWMIATFTVGTVTRPFDLGLDLIFVLLIPAGVLVGMVVSWAHTTREGSVGIALGYDS